VIGSGVNPDVSVLNRDERASKKRTKRSEYLNLASKYFQVKYSESVGVSNT